MKPVHQTTFKATYPDPETGNCIAACLASLFELSIDDVPNFAAIPGEDGEWWDALQSWLTERGWHMLTLENPGFRWPGLCLAGGRSPRGDFGHVVIYRNGELVHDPHPDGRGIRTLEDYWFLVPLDPSSTAPTQPVSPRSGIQSEKVASNSVQPQPAGDASRQKTNKCQ